MPTMTLERFTSQGLDLDTSAPAFGELESSNAYLGNPERLRERMREDGYLFLPGYLVRDEVMAARKVIVDRLAEEGCLDESYPTMDAVAKPGVCGAFRPDMAANNPPLHKLLYTGRMMDFYAEFLGGEVRHFDFTWMRVVSPGIATPPHCDIVYMGRGTTNLYTSWTPLGDVTYAMGGLMVLEGSHLHERLRAGYGSKDVDSYCTNRREAAPNGLGGGGNIRNGGNLSDNPFKLRQRLGGRWLTNEFQAGDLLIISMYTVHASLDNHSDRIRLSSDTRYQLASDPVDERWVGDNPIAHGPDAKRGMIC
ncbi:MAG: phytanoyl-CoA dioxygenase family protein [Armatimonadota bacterium]|nr:phytanoyl-CoA dioxygenase family protein [Armatimonadota bacterium]